MTVPGHGRWHRRLISTAWLTTDDDFLGVVSAACGPHLDRDGTHIVVVTEKVVSIAAGLSIDATEIRVGPLARVLAKRVRPRGDSLALAVPEKMQWVIDEIGRTRILFAAVAAAVTRPFGGTGAFYAIAGDNARSVDGVRGVYPNTLIPPLSPAIADDWTRRIGDVCGCDVAIIDMNDRGGSIRSMSPDLDHSIVEALVADNPLGSRDDSTPFAVFTRLDG